MEDPQSDTAMEAKKEQELIDTNSDGILAANDDSAESADEKPDATDNGSRGPQQQFRIVVTNLPKYFGFKQLKTWFRKQGLQPSKIKPTCGKGRTQNACFLNFRTAAEKNDAMRIISTTTFSGSVLSVKEANAAPDPYTRSDRHDKRKRNQNFANETEQNRSPEAEILDIVTNLHHLKYEDQLTAKQNHALQLLRKIHIQFIRKSQGTLPWLETRSNQLCSLESIRKSPITEKYRNKCEFSIGLSPSGERVIGFKLGKYKEGVVFVVPPHHCQHINDRMKQLVQSFEPFIRSSLYPPYDERQHTGHWHQLTIRTNEEGRTLVCVHLHPQKLSLEQIAEEKERFKNFCLTMDSSTIPDFVYWVLDDKTGGGPRRSEAMNEEMLLGQDKPEFGEVLLGFRFKVSPDAFFQVNTKAAEVLYSTVLEFADVNKDTVLLDLCCGTGTIGIVMAQHVKWVFGVELGADAVADARLNAEKNNVKNIDFECAKVEDALDEILREKIQPEDNVVVVLDPPRCGVHNSVVDSLRKAKRISRVIFMACAADNEYTINNLYGLCRNKSKDIDAGDIPFVPARCVPVDLFPLTKNIEMIFVFNRLNESQQNS